jgi:hypothetical protein
LRRSFSPPPSESRRAPAELDPELADQNLLVAADASDDRALSPEIFGPDIDEQDRAPDDVDRSRLQLLVSHRRFGRPDQLGGNLVADLAVGDRRTEVRRPVMLIADDAADRGDPLHENVRRGERAARGRRRAARLHDEVSRQPGVGVVEHIAAHAVADVELPSDVVHGPAEPAGQHIAGDAAAIAQERAVDELAVVQGQIAQDEPEIDMPPGLPQ